MNYLSIVVIVVIIFVVVLPHFGALEGLNRDSQSL